MKSIDPSTEQVTATFAELSERALDERLSFTQAAFEGWSEAPIADRAALMRGASEQLEKRQERLAQMISREMGKPIAQARKEIERCVYVCAYFADRAAAFLEPRPASTKASNSYVAYRPLGGVLGIMPWNFPLWQVFRYAAPTLMAGNVTILKPAPNVCGCALEAEQIFTEAGFPEGIFTAAICGVERVDQILDHPAIAAVTLTGSTAAGTAVAAKAGERLKKCVLELGGSDPYVVLEDADLERAAEAAVESRMDNSGQSCIAAKRMIVVERHRRDFERRVTELMESYEVGPPLDDDTRLGPLARADLRDELHLQVSESVEAGARLVTGGYIPKGEGYYYPPTVLADVTPGMPAYDEELFGPVACILGAEDEEAAIRTANDTRYGLGAAVFTEDVERGRRIAEQRLDAGSVFVNAPVKSDPRLPFGGIKRSGHGRELAAFGIHEFTNVKTVWVD